MFGIYAVGRRSSGGERGKNNRCEKQQNYIPKFLIIILIHSISSQTLILDYLL